VLVERHVAAIEMIEDPDVHPHGTPASIAAVV
jgi:hypothetical protein